MCRKSVLIRENNSSKHGSSSAHWLLIFGTLLGTLLLGSTAFGQAENPAWQVEARKYAEAHDWESALRVVNQQLARTPGDTDVRAWRARVLVWWGKLPEAETEYLEILKTSRKDPDIWLGLGNLYMREEKIESALRAFDTAVELDPTRADLLAARGRGLRAAGDKQGARLEFQRALSLDPTSMEARGGLASLRPEAKHELRFGQENDLFNYADANHDEWVSLVSRWTPYWTTSVAGSFYQRSGMDAGKFVGSVTGRKANWGAVTVGGAIGHDNAVIPKSEFFFDLDHGVKTGERSFVRALEIVYGQHWYWYQASRILTLSGTTIFYLPREWTLTVGATGARSAFSGTGAEWRPSGLTRLGFPVAGWRRRRLSGNVFFAVGSEDFAQIDQIGSFASQTWGGGLRFQMTDRQDVMGYGSYQRRTQNRTDTGFGLSYGIHF
ncbi:MAG: tetratricopeptide repeat protein [Candidatus Acidiferrales bacterium]